MRQQDGDLWPYTSKYNTAGFINMHAEMASPPQIVFATVLERIFLRYVPSMLSIIGTVIILTSAIYVAVSRESWSPWA